MLPYSFSIKDIVMPFGIAGIVIVHYQLITRINRCGIIFAVRPSGALFLQHRRCSGVQRRRLISPAAFS